MALHFEEIAAAVAPGAHAILVLDQAGWLGHVPSTVSSRSIGSLALGYHDSRNLIYAGRVSRLAIGALEGCQRAQFQTLVRAPKPTFVTAHKTPEFLPLSGAG